MPLGRAVEHAPEWADLPGSARQRASANPYPFVNVEGATTSDSPNLDRLMTWGNWETVYIFVDDDGSLSWVLQYTYAVPKQGVDDDPCHTTGE